MTETTADNLDAPRKAGKTAMILWLVLALAGGGAGFYAVWSGLLPIGESVSDSGHTDPHDAGNASVESHQTAAVGKTAFVPMEPIVISLNSGSRPRHLRFRAELEVDAERAKSIEHVLPRIIDVLNGYLRALELSDLQDSLALTRLRAQMLRRVNIVTDGGVRNFLIMEFVLN